MVALQGHQPRARDHHQPHGRSPGAGTCDELQRGLAERDAHKLAGVAGTFGFAEASRLARDAEHLLQAPDLSAHELAEALESIVTSLRHELHREALPIAPEVATRTDEPYVLIVDDDVELAERLALEAEAQHLEVKYVATLEAARQAIAEREPDVVLLDLTFDGEAEESMILLTELAERDPACPCWSSPRAPACSTESPLPPAAPWPSCRNRCLPPR